MSPFGPPWKLVVIGAVAVIVVRQFDGTTPAPVTWDRLLGSSTSAP